MPLGPFVLCGDKKAIRCSALFALHRMEHVGEEMRKKLFVQNERDHFYRLVAQAA